MMKKLCAMLAILMLCCLGIACAPRESGRILTTTLTSQTVEIGSSLEIPGAVLTENGETIENIPINIRVYNPRKEVIATRPGTVKIDELGIWKVVYSASRAIDITVEVTCKDTAGPEIRVADFVKFGYVGESLSLPEFSFVDVSGVAYDKAHLLVEYFNEETATWEGVEYDEMANVLIPEKVGNYRLSVSVEDEHGNTTTEHYNLLIIDEDWTFPDLEAGYLAGYDSDVYANFIQIPTMAHGIHWAGLKDPEAEYVTGVPGAKDGDAVKVTLYRGSYGAIFQLKFPAIPAGSLEAAGDTLVVRFKGGNEVRNWFVNDDMGTENISVLSEPDKDGWRFLSIPLTQGNLKGSAYNLKSIEIISGTSMAETEDWYFDFVKMNKTLTVPQNLSAEKGMLTWEPVPNAASYRVWYNGTEFETIEPKFVFDDSKSAALRVMAIGLPEEYVSSSWSEIFTTFSQQSGYIAQFDSQAYAFLVQDGRTPGGAEWNSASFVSEYVASGVSGAVDGDAVRVTVGKNAGSMASIQISLPQATESLTGNIILLRLRLDGAQISQRWINSLTATQNAANFILGQPDADGWRLVTIAKSLLGEQLSGLKTIELGFGMFAGNTATLYLDFAKAATKLETPEVSYENDNLTWTPVSNAERYAVTFGGKSYFTENTSYTVPKDQSVTVKAVGDGIDFVDSEICQPLVTGEIADDYFADYRSAAFEDLVNANGMPGNSWWDSTSIETEYLAKDVDGADNGDALKVTLGRNMSDDLSRVGFTLIMPKADTPTGDIIVFRFWASAPVTVGRLQLNWGLSNQADLSSVGTLKRESDGWCTIEILLSQISMGAEELRTISIGFFGVNAETLDLYLDWVRMANQLAAPAEFAYVEGILSWTAVPHAESYIVSYGGHSYPINDTNYEVPVNQSVTVKAIGDGKTYRDSEESAVFVTILIPEGYYAAYNHTAYESMVNGSGIPGNPWWDSTSFEAEYLVDNVTGADDGDALKVTLGVNSEVFAHAGVTLTLPVVAEENLNGNVMLLRFRPGIDVTLTQLTINSGTETAKSLATYMLGNPYEKDSYGYWTLRIPLEVIGLNKTEIRTVSLGFEPVNQAALSLEVLFDWVRLVVQYQLDAPAGFVYENGILSWTAVSHAGSYIVSYGGQSYPVTDASCSVPVGVAVTVKAIGDNVLYLDSKESGVFMTVTVNDGYYADYNNAIFEEMVTPSAMPGNSWWDASSMNAEYVETGVVGADNGDALKVVLGKNIQDASQDTPARVGITLIFPMVSTNSYVGDTVVLHLRLGEDLRFNQLRINWGEDNQKDLSAFFLNGNNKFEKDSNGWYRIEIPLATIGLDAAALRTISMGFDEVAGETIEIFLDWVRIETQVTKPGEQEAGYYMDYNGIETENTVTVNALPGNSWWDSTSIKTEYLADGVIGAKDNDALKVTLGVNSTDFAHAGVNLNLAEVSKENMTGDTLVIRFKTGASAVLSQLWINGFGGEESSYAKYLLNNSFTPDADGWIDAVIPMSLIGIDVAEIKTIGLGFEKMTGENFEVLFDYVRLEVVAAE